MAPLLATAIHLASDAVFVMWYALSTKSLDHAGNTPANLAKSDLFQLDLRLIKFAEAAGYQDRIEANAMKNEEIGRRINRGIKVAVAASFILVGTLIAAYFIFPP